MKIQYVTFFAGILILGVQAAIAQNNDIFNGGTDDGFDAISFIQSANNSIYFGGSGDGFDSEPFIQGSNNNIYFGGSGDGFVAVRFLQEANNSIFFGGSGDGYVAVRFLQEANNSIFLGGSGDGYVATRFIQGANNNIFFGAAGDGFGQSGFIQNANNNIFAGAEGDGFDVASNSLIAVFEVRVLDATDDAEEELLTGSVTTNSVTLDMGIDDPSTEQSVGLRFQSIGIDPNAEIKEAYLEFVGAEKDVLPSDLIIYGEDTDDAITFSAVTKNITSRSKTANRVNWSPEPWTINVVYQSSDISDVIQEIILRCGWQNGNDITFIIEGDGTRVARAFEGGASTAPLLHVEYVVPVNTIYWNGCVDDDWHNPGNWSLNRIPVPTDKVVIFDVANQPIIRDGNPSVKVRELRLGRSSQLTVEGVNVTFQD